MLIERAAKENLKFENLVIKVKDTVLNALILKYTLSEKATYSEEHDSYAMDVNDTEMTPLPIDGKQTMGGVTCVMTNIFMCSALGGDFTEIHVAQPICFEHTGIYLTSQLVCSSSGGNSGGIGTGGWNPNTNNGPGTHGGGFGNTGSPIITAPIVDDENLVVSSPCGRIKNKLDKFPTLKQSLIDLEGTTNQSQENGIFSYSSATNTSQNAIQPLPSITIAGVTSIGLPDPPSPEKYGMIAHTHDAAGPTGTGSYSIFSWQDLTRFAELIHDGKIDDNNFAAFLATDDGTRYAITIDWPSAFADYFDIRKNYNQPSSIYNTDFKKAVLIDEAQKKYYSNTPHTTKIHLTSNPAADLIVFLKMKKDLKLDFTLFEVDPTYTTYTKVSLHSDGTSVKRDNCK